MAEAFLNHLAGDAFKARSAGLEKGTLNPFAIQVMKEVGIDISGNKTKDVNDFFRQGIHFDYVITVCDEANSERCPLFPGTLKTIHWSIDDPSSFTGTNKEKLEKTRNVRDEIRSRIEKFIVEFR